MYSIYISMLSLSIFRLLFKDYKDTFYNSSRHVTIYSYTIQLITFDILYYKQLLSGFNQVSKTDC